MSELRWIKIAVDIFDDEKISIIEAMPDGKTMIMIWVKLLCLAGKQNNSGVFLIGKIPCDHKIFAKILRENEKKIKKSLEIFENLGMIYKENGVYCLSNWEKHQALDSYESYQESHRKAQAKYKEKQKTIAKTTNKKMASDDIRGDITDDITDMSAGTSSLMQNDITEENRREENRREENKKEKEILSLLLSGNQKAIESATESGLAEIITVWTKSCPLRLTERVAEELLALAEEYGKPNLIDAIKAASDQGKVSVAYCRGILKNRAEGRDRPPMKSWAEREQERKKQELEALQKWAEEQDALEDAAAAAAEQERRKRSAQQ